MASGSHRKKYFQQEVIGQTNKAVIFKAIPQFPFPNCPQNIVAIKKIKNLNSSAFKQCQIFQKVQKYNQPNILKLYDHFNSTKHFYLIMQYCSKGNLFHQISNRKKQQTPFPIPDLIHHMLQLSKALLVLHQNCIVHRDIKPLNILISQQNILKIADFGQARKFVTFEHQVSIKGTLKYMSPQLNSHMDCENPELDLFQCDVWSMGKTFAQMATCEANFDNNLIDQNSLNIFITERLRLKQFPQELISIILSMLRRNSQQRATFREVCLRLQRLQEIGLGGQVQRQSLGQFQNFQPEELSIEVVGSIYVEQGVKICRGCPLEVIENFQLACQCLWHLGCLVMYLNRQVMEVQNIGQMKCFCGAQIQREVLDNIQFTGAARVKYTLIMFRETQTACGNCKFVNNGMMMLNQEFKNYTIVCVQCRLKFCSMCGKKNGCWKCNNLKLIKKVR